MYKTPVLLIALLSLVCLAGCCKKKQYCGHEKLDLTITGFYRSEVRTVWLKRYYWRRFDVKAIDSSLFSYSGNAPLPIGTKKDTISFSDYTRMSGQLTGIYHGNDWVLYFPSINRSITVTEITDEGKGSEMVKCGEKDGCVNKTAGFYIGGDYWNGNHGYVQK
jgi:hypothetical protein